MQGATPHRVVASLTAIAAISLFASHAVGAGSELPQRGVKEMGVAYGGMVPGEGDGRITGESVAPHHAGGLILNMGSITLRGGIAFDESPVPDAQRRTPRGPDNDRTIYAAGLSWAPTENFSLDAAYTLTRFDETEIENPENPAGTQHVIRGDYEGRLDSYALQLNYRC